MEMFAGTHMIPHHATPIAGAKIVSAGVRNMFANNNLRIIIKE
ncbi:14881_t:CDS:1, partial [Racocetra fulgida]